jgi:enoyl-CoA hydratase
VNQVTMATDGRVAIITVDNQAKRNAYTPEMVEQLADHLTAFDEEDELWAAVLCSAGEHTTAGLDLPKFFGPDANWVGTPKGRVDPFGLGRRTDKPVIAVVQGITYTIGIELALAADIVIAADTARFSQIEAKRGIAPLGGGHFRFLTRTGWGNAMYHLLLCDEFDAREALRIGLVQEVVPFGQQLDRALELARAICKNAPLGVRETKRAARAFLDAAEKAAIAEIPRIRETVFASKDFLEGVQSFVERREAHFQGR